MSRTHMGIPVDRPPFDAVDEQRPAEPGALPTIQAEPGAEPAIQDQNWQHLSTHLSKPFLSELRRYAYGFTRNLEDAEDVVSDALLKTASALHTLRHRTPGAVKSFIRTTIKRLAIDLARRNTRIGKLFPPEHALDASNSGDNFPSPELEPSKQTHFDAEEDQILQALTAIPEASRRVSIMRFLWEYEVEEIAQKLDIKPSTVRKHLERARKVFRQHFLREGGTYEAE